MKMHDDSPKKTALPLSTGKPQGTSTKMVLGQPGKKPEIEPLDIKPEGEPKLPSSSLIIWVIGALFLCFLTWAWVFKLDEVSAGSGKVVPSAKEQIIQSLEGGILAELNVREGDIVEKGQILAQLDRTKSESFVNESASKLRAALATSARLSAEVSGERLIFPEEVLEDEDLVHAETKLYTSRKEALSSVLAGIAEALSLIRNELALTEPLVERGAASAVEVLRLKRQANELKNRAAEARNQYFVRAHEELAKANAEVEAQRSVTDAREDSLTRLTFVSPVRGIVKEVAVTTLGGVVSPNGRLMQIVPLDDQLLVEARISPRDVAFIHPGQMATVKITAYDYAIYGGLKGRVTTISPDTIQDDVKRDQYYYRVYIRTEEDHLKNKADKKFPIVPGMIATVDIHTGSKTIMEYLIKPFNRAAEALRER